jgi:phospholipase/carboxylesterase
MSIDYIYDVKLPDGYGDNTETKYPVIFALHGLGSNEQDMVGLLGELNNDFIIIAIRGNLPQGSGFAYFHIKSIGNPIREQFDQSMQKLEWFIEYATTQYAIDPARRYLLGFSQGAILSMSLALVMGERMKGIVALNGYIPSFVKDEYELQSVKKCPFSYRMANMTRFFPSSWAMIIMSFSDGYPIMLRIQRIHPHMACL